MTDYQLLNQIDELVASKTFNLDALDGIKKLKDDLKKTLEERDALQARYDTLAEAHKLKAEEVVRLTEHLNEQAKTIENMREVVVKGNAALWEKKIAEASAAAYKDAMAMVFKPNAVRETVQRTVAKPVQGQPGGNGYSPSPGFLSTGQESETITREDA
jgi:septal ring factor EnvC (AmiA/AmiB activator)